MPAQCLTSLLLFSFVSKAVGESSQLTFVDPTTNHAIIKVDNTSNVLFNDKRNTVRIATNDSYGVGTVWAADMLHVPYGVSKYAFPFFTPDLTDCISAL